MMVKEGRAISTFESIHDNLLQGVSQQVPRSRLPGQLTLQENMISDPVTGLRRRPGSVVNTSFAATGATSNSIKAWRTDIAGVSCECFLDVNTGKIYIKEVGKTTVKTLQDDYLKSADIQLIQHASVGDSLYILNSGKIPTGVSHTAGTTNPNMQGFAFFKASALSKTFTLTLKHTGGTYTANYTTPDGTDPSHIGLSTTDHIALHLATELRHELTDVHVWADGSYLFMLLDHATHTNLSVTSNTGSLYVTTSNSSEIKDPNDLPPRLPAMGDGYIMATGRSPDLTYYRYDSNSVRWVESASYGSITSISNMPIAVYWDASSSDWKLETANWGGRTSGDDHSNPIPDFVDWGITGISSYQGRLVLMAGSWVWLSATNKPRVFFRTTVNDVVDSDPIGIGSSAATSAAFRYAVGFNKDLILFSNEFQALIPGGNAALTPRNASIVVTSTYSTDITTNPVTLGRSLMYGIPRSANFYGMMEMLPSPYTDSQYVSTDATEHIPRYLPGRCRFAVASSVSSIVALGSTEDSRALYIHEYMWDGDEKVLRAWHRWSFPLPVAYAYFSGGLINIVTVNNGILVVCTVDPRSGQDSQEGNRVSYLDYSVTRNVTASTKRVALETDYLTFLGTHLQELRTAYVGGDLDGYEIGSDLDGIQIQLNTSTTATKVNVGLEFISSFAPSPPIIRGEDELPITTNKMTLTRYFITTKATSDFEVSVCDTANQTVTRVWGVNPVRWLSSELNLGKTPVNGETGSIVPCRVNAATSQVSFTVTGLGEFNVLSLEYTCRTNQRMRRR